MKEIIIVGTGKAALLHYNSYKKIKGRPKIYFCDIKKNSQYIPKKKIYSCIQECIEMNNLIIDNLIVDICTPKSEFLSIIDNCNDLGITNILVEKPFVADKKTLKKYNRINIVMVENYLFSKLTILIKEFIDKNNKNISLIYTNFSKNRISESLAGRGYNKKVTLNYEIEIPHQIYLTQYFLNNSLDIQNCITCSRDLKMDNISLENHGYGLIISKHKDVNIIYESNLASFIAQKRIIICTKDNYTIEGNYALYSSDLKLLKPANMNIYHMGKLIYSKKIRKDDNFACFIKKSYLYFNNKMENPNFIDIISFSELMKLYCGNLLKRKMSK